MAKYADRIRSLHPGDIGRALRVLAGVDKRLLAEVPTEQARYTALGGTVLGTATIAAFSMSMALSQVLGGFAAFVLPLALIWGLFVLNLDRWLVSSSAGSRWHRQAAILLPRVLLAVFFGVVIAEPLVMRIFQTAIEQHIRTERQEELASLASTLLQCNPEPTATEEVRAAAATPRCDEYRMSFATTAQAAAGELAAKHREAEQLRPVVDTDAARLAALEELARNECAGTTGPGLTGRPGRGPECLRREREADDFRRSHRIEAHIEELARLRERIDRLQSEVNAAQTSYHSARNAEIERQVAERQSSHGPIGMLERFQAMHELTRQNAFLIVSSWWIRLLFIAVDCLPVLVKFFGGPTTYDRLVDAGMTSAERKHQEKIRTAELAVIADLEVEQHRITTTKHQRIAEIDLDAREHEVNLNARIDLATDTLTEDLLSRPPTGVTVGGA